MFRQKSRIRLGIRSKIFAGLFIAFAFGCITLTYSVEKQINDRNETQIKKDLGVIKDTTQVYVRQTIVLNNGSNTETSFELLSTNILSDLYGAGMHHVALYSNKGQLITATRNTLFATEYFDDLNMARNGDVSYTIVRDNKDALAVYCSIPVIIVSNRVGIVRYYIDYTDLLKNGREYSSTILRITLIILTLTFAIVAIAIQMLLAPVRQLASISNQVSDDLNNGVFDENRYLALQQSHRKDELGDLTNNYKVMLETVQNQLEKLQSDKNKIYELMENRKEFYDNVTHELKTPLTTIHGYAQLLQDNGIEDRVLFMQGVRSIIDESDRLHRMVVQLLEMSQNEREKVWEKIEVVGLLQDVAQAMELKAKRYNSHIHFPKTGNFTITGIKERVREVFVNVIDNAIKYGTNPQTIELDIARKEEWIEISVKNTGKGLNDKEIDHIFEPFYRADKQLSREQGSAGLGLSICMQIMKEHSGEIVVNSLPGKKTTFILRFPVKIKLPKKDD